MDIEKLVDLLIDKKKTISVMESFTGGALTNEITNIENGSKVLKFSAITCLDDFKIKMGLAEDTFSVASVNSISVARSMSKAICDFSDSDYGIGITGNTDALKDGVVYVSICDKNCDKYYTLSIDTLNASIRDNKRVIVINVVKLLLLVVS